MTGTDTARTGHAGRPDRTEFITAVPSGRSSPSGLPGASAIAGIGGAVGLVAAIVLALLEQPWALVIPVAMVGAAICGLLLWVVAKEPVPAGTRPGTQFILAAAYLGGSLLAGWFTGNWAFALLLCTVAAIPLTFGIRARTSCTPSRSQIEGSALP
ncbi:hypothetical protein ACO0LV_08715 [Pseudactinotalea sp. Z1739]|uniref:hypothetical protein n=1 Tax=Pseudactinotalea sp. Z1739 TaxID=3413028 RepID=UPI003C7A6554